METALYFPHVRVPETPWFSHVLLYWDKAAAIVPSNARYDVDTPYIKELRAADLLEYVRARDAASHASQFHDELLRYAEQFRDSHEPRNWRRLYTEKMDYRLMTELKRMGLARSSRFLQFDVEERTAAAYMGLLAMSACEGRSDYFPVTDASAGLAPSGQRAHRLRSLRYASILQALPTPSGPLPVADLLAFKERNREGLTRLRRTLGTRLAGIAAIDDDGVRDQLTTEALDEIRDDVRRLASMMSERRWPGVIYEGLGVLVGGLGIGAAVAAGGSPLAVGLSLAAGAVGLGDAARRALVAGHQQHDSADPLAYAALVSTL